MTDCGAFGGDGARLRRRAATDRSTTGRSRRWTRRSPLGDYAAGEKHRYLFAAALDPSAGNEYQGDGASARFVWDAAQD